MAIEPYMPVLANAPKAPIGDIKNRRTAVDGLFNLLMLAWPTMGDVEHEVQTVKAEDEHELQLYYFTKRDPRAQHSL